MSSTKYRKAEYIWVGGNGELRSKTKVLHTTTSVSLKELPAWNFDGSSTGQAPGADSEVVLIPRAFYPDPFRRSELGENVIVVCDTYDATMKPLPTNSRYLADLVFKEKPDEKPWFGLEQEYVFFLGGRPLGFPKSKARAFSPLTQIGFPQPQGPYYCSAGAGVAFGREIVEQHLEHCLYAGLKISGVNAEVMPGQWEFQVGPCEGIESGDMMIASRYVLLRVAEIYGVSVSFSAKPMAGEWNGSGCHTNYSTDKMRNENGALESTIYPSLEKLKQKHKQHISCYGGDNDARLTGKHETADIGEFSYGVANRGASVRIPNQTKLEGKGYFEDRRPAGDMDPYVVTSMIFDTTALDGKHAEKFSKIETKGVDIPAKDDIPKERKQVEKVLPIVKNELEVVNKEVSRMPDQPAIKKAPEEKESEKAGGGVKTLNKQEKAAAKPKPAVRAKKKAKKKGGCVSS